MSHDAMSFDPPADYCLLCCNSGYVHDPGCPKDPNPLRAEDIHGLCPGGPIQNGGTCAVCNMSEQTHQRLLAMWALGAHECRPRDANTRESVRRRRAINGRTDGPPRRRCKGCGDELQAGDDALVQEAVFWGVQCGCAERVESSPEYAPTNQCGHCGHEHTPRGCIVVDHGGNMPRLVWVECDCTNPEPTP